METYKAKGLSRFEIRAVAAEVRKLLSISDSSEIPILRTLEYIVTVLDYELDIVNDSQLPNKYAETYPSEKLIVIRQSVYEGAFLGDKHSRFTIAHEIGHLFLHENNRISFARNSDIENLKPYESPEWQANVFAAEFLVPFSEIQTLTQDEIAKKYNVSKKVAYIQSTYTPKIPA